MKYRRLVVGTVAAGLLTVGVCRSLEDRTASNEPMRVKQTSQVVENKPSRPALQFVATFNRYRPVNLECVANGLNMSMSRDQILTAYEFAPVFVEVVGVIPKTPFAVEKYQQELKLITQAELHGRPFALEYLHGIDSVLGIAITPKVAYPEYDRMWYEIPELNIKAPFSGRDEHRFARHQTIHGRVFELWGQRQGRAELLYLEALPER